MKPVHSDDTIIEGYVKLLEGLSPANKLDLIARLTASVKLDIGIKKTSFEASFGAWQSDQTAEEIITQIRNSRTFTRQIEDF
jgi:hypothetical protein